METNETAPKAEFTVNSDIRPDILKAIRQTTTAYRRALYYYQQEGTPKAERAMVLCRDAMDQVINRATAAEIELS